VGLLGLMACKAWANARSFSALQRMDDAVLWAPTGRHLVFVSHPGPALQALRI
jgi:hypothetical protein